MGIMGIREFERIFAGHVYPSFLYDLKSESEAIKQFEEKYSRIKHSDKIDNSHEYFERLIKALTAGHIAEFQRKSCELKRMVEEGKINPDNFKLEIICFEEQLIAVELYRILDEKVKTVSSEERELYERAKENLIASSVKYDLKRLEADLLRYYPELAKYSK
jgi:hypothetical protein